jgi:hypothetical protein
MPKRKLPPPPDAIQVPATREGPEWEEFCAAHPLHQDVCGRASESVTAARVNAIIDWFHQGAAYRTVVRRGSAEWGLVGRRVEELIALADQEMKQALMADRHEYLARMITRIDGMVEEATKDRQFSAAAGLISIVGRWLALDPSTQRRI